MNLRIVRPGLLGLVLCCSAFAANAQAGLTSQQVRAQLEAQGYTHIDDIEFENGMWSADARSADGNRVGVSLDPRTGQVFPDEQVSNLSKADVDAKLAAAGYTNVHDVEYEDGLWKAEADDPAGRDVEVRLDPRTGQIVGKEKD